MTLAIDLGQYMIPAFVIAGLLAFLLIFKVMASRYQKIPPNKVAIIYGRGTKVAGVKTAGAGEEAIAGVVQGCKVVSGGGVLVWPIFQEIDFMDTSIFNMPIHETSVPNKDNVKITVTGFAACKISTAPVDLQTAAMAFLGQGQDQLQQTISSLLIGHLRSIIGKLNIDEILRDRDAFNKMVVGETAPELKKMGIVIVSLVIQDVADEHGYIDALGKKVVAEAIRDADITVAQAKAETRKKTSTADKEAALVEAQNAALVAEAEKERDVKKATFKAAADTEKAKADQALGIATAAQQQTLVVAEAERDAARAEAQIKVQAKEAERRQQELIATVIRPAEAQKEAAVITAEGQKQAAIKASEGQQQVAVLKAKGEAEAAETLGKGQAAQTLATLNAKAEGEAAVTLKALMALADGEAAKKGKMLLAEAEGTLKLAEAYAKFDESARFLYILQNLSPLVATTGDALEKVVRAMFEPAAAALGQIDNVNITDLGGDGKAIQKFGGTIPEFVFKTLAGLKMAGIDLSELLTMAKANPEGMLKLLGQAMTPAASAGAGAAASVASPAGGEAPKA